MNLWSFYDLASGLFLGRQFSGPTEALASNTPPGAAALEGSYHPDRWAVDLATGGVVPRTPPRPADTELYTWELHPVIRVWEQVPTFEGQRAAMVGEAMQELVAAEGTTDRALRELILADPASPAHARMLQIEAAVQAIRTRIAAIKAATTPEELHVLGAS